LGYSQNRAFLKWGLTFIGFFPFFLKVLLFNTFAPALSAFPGLARNTNCTLPEPVLNLTTSNSFHGRKIGFQAATLEDSAKSFKVVN
jgi:hypothetical protein